jgi:hypothetical protein
MFCRLFRDLADRFQARGCQHVSYVRGELNVFDRRIIRQFRRRIDQMSFGHFPLAFGLSQLIDRPSLFAFSATDLGDR